MSRVVRFNDNPNYNPNAAFDDGSCFVGGCTFPNACNYNPEADYQIQGSCDFTSCTGCTNPEACNYDAEATIDNGLCDLPDFAYDCDGNCLNDADGDGVCDELEVLGCTDGNSPTSILMPQTMTELAWWVDAP